MPLKELRDILHLILFGIAFQMSTIRTKWVSLKLDVSGMQFGLKYNPKEERLVVPAEKVT